MAKGFNPTETLGYVIGLYPEANGYAAKRVKESDGQRFIGITNILEDAHYWKKSKVAQNAIADYMELIRDIVDSDGQATVLVNAVKRSKDGHLSQTNDRTLEFSRDRY